MSGVEGEVYRRMVGNHDGRPRVCLPAAVAEGLGMEIGGSYTTHVDGGRAIVTPGSDVPARVDAGSRPAAQVDAGESVAVRFDEEQLATARERLPADADALQAADVLADLAELDEEYRTDDGRDAIAAVLADTDE
jgi:hypothetical protein